jgi:hypothetical protein
MSETQSVSAQSALEALGVSLEEAVEIDQSLRRDKGNNKNICICGHPESRHSFHPERNRWVCATTRIGCQCKTLRSVLHSEDVRPFLCKTTGGAGLHALTRGITALALMDPPKKITWTIELKCDSCGSSDSIVNVVPVTQQGVPTAYATGYDAFLCQDCREEREGVNR